MKPLAQLSGRSEYILVLLILNFESGRSGLATPKLTDFSATETKDKELFHWASLLPMFMIRAFIHYSKIMYSKSSGIDFT